MTQFASFASRLRAKPAPAPEPEAPPAPPALAQAAAAAAVATAAAPPAMPDRRGAGGPPLPAPQPAQQAQPPAEPPTRGMPAVDRRAGNQPDPQVTQVIRNFVGEMRRLRARAAELFEIECETMLQALAGEVLARELELAPADLAALVDRARERLRNESPRVRVSANDIAALGPDFDAEGDPSLGTGDVVIETRMGVIDMRLGSRLRAVLAARRVNT